MAKLSERSALGSDLTMYQLWLVIKDYNLKYHHLTTKSWYSISKIIRWAQFHIVKLRKNTIFESLIKPSWVHRLVWGWQIAKENFIQLSNLGYSCCDH
jgi:hypothetical protein